MVPMDTLNGGLAFDTCNSDPGETENNCEGEDLKGSRSAWDTTNPRTCKAAADIINQRASHVESVGYMRFSESGDRPREFQGTGLVTSGPGTTPNIRALALIRTRVATSFDVTRRSSTLYPPKL